MAYQSHQYNVKETWHPFSWLASPRTLSDLFRWVARGFSVDTVWKGIRLTKCLVFMPLSVMSFCLQWCIKLHSLKVRTSAPLTAISVTRAISTNESPQAVLLSLSLRKQSNLVVEQKTGPETVVNVKKWGCWTYYNTSILWSVCRYCH